MPCYSAAVCVTRVLTDHETFDHHPGVQRSRHRRCDHPDKVRELDLGRDVEKEIIVVNDGSSDGTRAALAPFENVAGVRVHHSPVNLGKGSSVRIGFSFASGDIITIEDADLELDPAEYKTLIAGRSSTAAPTSSTAPLHLARAQRQASTFWLANKALAALTNSLYGGGLTDIETCYKVFRADVIPQLKLKAARFEIEPELTAQLLKRGFRIKELPIGYSRAPTTRARRSTGRTASAPSGCW